MCVGVGVFWECLVNEMPWLNLKDLKEKKKKENKKKDKKKSTHKKNPTSTLTKNPWSSKQGFEIHGSTGAPLPEKNYGWKKKKIEYMKKIS